MERVFREEEGKPQSDVVEAKGGLVFRNRFSLTFCRHIEDQDRKKEAGDWCGGSTWVGQQGKRAGKMRDCEHQGIPEFEVRRGGYG